MNGRLQLGFVVCVCLPCVALAQPSSPSPDRFAICHSNADSYIGAMKMLEASLRANYERISTWSGTYELNEESLQHSFQAFPAGGPDGGAPIALTGNLWLQRTVMVRFAVDFRTDRLFTTF